MRFEREPFECNGKKYTVSATVKVIENDSVTSDLTVFDEDGNQVDFYWMSEVYCKARKLLDTKVREECSGVNYEK